MPDSPLSSRTERQGALAVLAVIVAIAIAGAASGSGRARPEAIPALPVDLNDAPESELSLLPGLGPDRARRIIVHREIFGPFRSVDDVSSVKGIGSRATDRLRAFAIAGGGRRD